MKSSLGKALAKSLAGETTLAAMLTASVATTTVNIEIAITADLLKLADQFHRIPKLVRLSCADKSRPPPK